MLITKRGELRLDAEQILEQCFEGARHYVKGFFYLHGLQSGEESVAEVERARKNGEALPFRKMFGSYTYLIRQENGDCVFFPANSLMSCLYLSDAAVSDSYLELLEYHRENGLPLRFNAESLCEYYTMGNLYFDKTFVSEIRILPNECYVCFADGSLSVCEKGLGAFESRSSLESAQEYYDALAHALGNQKVASALTGGYDSRLIFAELQGKIPVHAFFSANVKTKDGEVAQRVAESVGAELEIFRTEQPELSEALLERIIISGDGIQPISIDSDCRTIGFREKLRADGYTVQLTGDGGVLHKDWEWMQDLPFYRRKKTNLPKYYSQRLAHSCAAPQLGERLKPLYETQKERIIEQLEPCVKSMNTESYDALYYYVNGNRIKLYNCARGRRFTAYAPMNELELVRYSYHLPRRKRFYYNQLRELTTASNKTIARIPTNYGTTASSEKRYLFRDGAVQIKEYAVKGARMIGRKLHLPALDKGVLDWTLEPQLRALPLAKSALAWAKQTKLVDAAADTETLPYQQLSNLTHLYWLRQRFGIEMPEE